MTHHIGLFVPATKLTESKGIVIPARWIIFNRNFSPESYDKILPTVTQLATISSTNASGSKGYNQYIFSSDDSILLTINVWMIFMRNHVVFFLYIFNRLSWIFREWAALNRHWKAPWSRKVKAKGWAIKECLKSESFETMLFEFDLFIKKFRKNIRYDFMCEDIIQIKFLSSYFSRMKWQRISICFDLLWNSGFLINLMAHWLSI